MQVKCKQGVKERLFKPEITNSDACSGKQVKTKHKENLKLNLIEQVAYASQALL